MDRLGRLATNCLVWLAAICVSLGPSWAYSCECPATIRESAAGPAGGTACCRASSGCCAENEVENASCCDALTDGQCQSEDNATGDCDCKDLGDQPTSDPIAAPNRKAGTERLTQPSGATSANCRMESDPTSGSPHWLATSRASSGIERCILLCRFIL